MNRPLLAHTHQLWDVYLKQEVEAKRIPRYLYKYREPSTFTEHIITDHKLWFSKPDNFNDPFDGKVRIRTNNTLSEIKSYWERDADIPRAERRSLIQQMVRDPIKRDVMVNKVAHEIINQTGICCYAEEADNILMWSHYGASHSGVCLKFDVLADPAFFHTLIPVSYSADYPNCNFIRFPDDATEKLIGTKAKLWEYEKEWRVLKHDRIGLHPFSKLALTEVLFGCKASKNFVSRVRRLARESGSTHLTYKKAQVSQTRFSLQFKELT